MSENTANLADLLRQLEIIPQPKDITWKGFQETDDLLFTYFGKECGVVHQLELLMKQGKIEVACNKALSHLYGVVYVRTIDTMVPPIIDQQKADLIMLSQLVHVKDYKGKTLIDELR